MTDLSSSPCRLRPRLLIWSLVTVGARVSQAGGEHLQGVGAGQRLFSCGGASGKRG